MIPLTRTERAAGGLALLLGLLHLLLARYSGTDLAAQLARASFAREAPFTPVDLSWYSGVHPYAYSLLAPWVMALLGVALSGLLAAVAGSVLLARLLKDSRRPMAASLLGAAFLVANIVSGRTTFALGAVAGLAALLVLPRRPWAAVLAVLTALLSPVAAAFLGFIAALLVLHRRPGGWTLGLGASVPVVVLAVLFPGGGVQPFGIPSAVPAILVGLGLAALTNVPIVRTGALLYVLAVIVFVSHDDPFGSNVLRLGVVLAATLVLATTHRGLGVTILAVIGCLAWQVDPTHGDIRAISGPRTDHLAAELLRLGSQRAEVAALLNHRESWHVAEHVSLARGWTRQLDRQQNPLFYKETLTSEEYRAWLYDNAVDTVAVPLRGPIDSGSATEVALLLKQPIEGLQEVWSDPDWKVFRVQSPASLVTAPARIVSSTRTAIALRSDVAAMVDVRVRWSRWLSLAGPGCVEKNEDWTRVRFARAGSVTLGSSLRPSGHC